MNHRLRCEEALAGGRVQGKVFIALLAMVIRVQQLPLGIDMSS
jgi:hypothetical protein